MAGLGVAAVAHATAGGDWADDSQATAEAVDRLEQRGRVDPALVAWFSDLAEGRVGPAGQIAGSGGTVSVTDAGAADGPTPYTPAERARYQDLIDDANAKASAVALVWAEDEPAYRAASDEQRSGIIVRFVEGHAAELSEVKAAYDRAAAYVESLGYDG